VASVVEPGQRERRLWLPDNQTGWYDFATQQWFSGGQWITLAAPLETQPMLVRAGAGLPLSERLRHVDTKTDDRRTLQLFPLKGKGVSHGVLFEDDGESWAYQQGNALWLNWKMRSAAEAIHLNFQRKGSFQPAWQTLKIMLPPSEQRQLFIDGVAVDKAQAEAVLADIAAE